MGSDGKFGTDPRRPLNAFMLFARRRRSQIGGKVADSSKVLAREWKKMGKKEKRKYCAQAQALKVDFRERFPDFKYTQRRKHPRQKRGKSAEVPTPVTPEELSSPKTRTSGNVKALQHPQISESTANTSRALLRTVFHRAHHPQEHCAEASASKIPDCGLHLDEYKGPFKCHWMNPYPYEGNSCHWEVDDKWGQLLDEFDRVRRAPTLGETRRPSLNFKSPKRWTFRF
ncbi:hypothetical protein B0H13DRAFT_1910870 [Mycena leptocephala]|nr:hypothetical protein B0H13DRAFT_1910870 [Mycena leptocephala]